MKVTILDDWFDTLRGLPCFARLAGHEVTVWNDHLEDDRLLAERLADTEALVLIRERTPLRAGLIEQLPKLRLVSQRGAWPHIDVEDCSRHGVAVCSNQGADQPNHSAAELTWALILAAVRDLPRQYASVRSGQWQAGVGKTLRGRTLGIFGYGRIGRIVAEYGRAFGMTVLVWASEESRLRASADGWRVAQSKEAFLAACDVVSLHLRLGPATRGVLSKADLACMKDTALLVNTSRSGLIASGDLYEALQAGRPAMAALDVFDVEPVIHDPLLDLENVIATPHIGYVTEEEFELQFSDVFDQINAFADGAPIHLVNPEALSART